MKKIVLIVCFVLILVGFSFSASGKEITHSTNEKIRICHAVGREGTTHYVELYVSKNAYFGHFDNHGTPLAGHENDYIPIWYETCGEFTF